MNQITNTAHLGALLQTEKVTRELDGPCMSIEIDFKVKVVSISTDHALSHNPNGTAF